MERRVSLSLVRDASVLFQLLYIIEMIQLVKSLRNRYRNSNATYTL